MAGTIVVDRLESDASYASSINIASPVIVSNTFALPAGSAAAPSIFPTGDTNTGIFFPAADTIAFTEGGAEAMRINANGSVLIGKTTTAFQTAGRGVLEINGTSDAILGLTKTGTNLGFLYHTGTDLFLTQILNGATIFSTNNAVRLVISSSGRLNATHDTTKGPYIKSGDAVSVASGGTVTLTTAVAGGAIVVVYNANIGEGGMFWVNYSGTVTKIAGDGSTADSGSATINVYKSAGSHTSTFKNRSASTYSYYIAVYSADGRIEG